MMCIVSGIIFSILFRFTEPPECHYPPGSSLSEITKYSLDTSYILDNMAEKHERLLSYFYIYYYNYYLQY